jgi:hypothetical protein
MVYVYTNNSKRKNMFFEGIRQERWAPENSVSESVGKMLASVSKTALAVYVDLDAQNRTQQVMRDGTVVQSGQYESLLSAGLDFESLVKIHNEALEKVDDLTLATTTSWDDDLAEFSPYLEPQTSTNSTSHHHSRL